MKKENLPVAIIGGGPIGLAAAAHLTKRRIPFILFEIGISVGSNFLSWGHVRVFSPWKYNIDKVAEELLSETGWMCPNKDDLPTGKDLVDLYLLPLANHPQLKPHIHLNSRVMSINRKGLDKMKTAGRDEKPFVIRIEQNGSIIYFEAKAVLDASGTWNQPNPIGSGGVFAEGEKDLSEYVYYGIPDVKKGELRTYKDKNVLVVGGGHSAINVLLDLADIQEEHPETKLNWVLRKKDISAVYGGQNDDALEARGTLGIRIEALVNSGRLKVFTPFHILSLSKTKAGIEVLGNHDGKTTTIESIDRVISNTGSRPNLDIIRERRIDMDSSLESVFDLAGLIDPNIHSCGTVRPHGEKELVSCHM
ncbi:MAG: NAD(P)-binding domain-containing protein [Saprospiraceae bacterium]|nr:NAD(P)-binding domain-containing protein [Saprospiraceae bacterium]